MTLSRLITRKICDSTHGSANMTWQHHWLLLEAIGITFYYHILAKVGVL